MKQPVKSALLATALVCLLAGLQTASAQSRRGEGEALTTCDAPLGTMSIIERAANDPDMPPMLRFVMQMQQRQGLLSTPQLLRLLVQRSNCFTVVERSATGMAAMERERALMQSGEMEEGSRMGGGQVVASDYSLNGEVLFSGETGGFGGGGGGVIGGLVGRMRKNEAWVTLTTVDNRSGVQLAMAEGSATKRSWSGLAAMFGGGGVGGFGAYSKTPEGKIILPAFVNAFNIMVNNLREHQARQPARPAPAQQQEAIAEQAPAGEPALTQTDIEVPAQTAQAPSPAMSLYEAQHRLTRHGYSPGPVNGEMGEETASALRDFQMDKNLPVTGQVDEATANALRAVHGAR